MSEEIREADAALKAALIQRLAAGETDIHKTLVAMAKYVPEDGFPSDMTPIYGDEHDELDKAPFFSETYLYNLIGKEDARTVLAYISQIARGLGYDGWWEIQEKALG